METPRWQALFAAAKDHPHWPLLEQAAAKVGHPGAALDLGCGPGAPPHGWSGRSGTH